MQNLSIYNLFSCKNALNKNIFSCTTIYVFNKFNVQILLESKKGFHIISSKSTLKKREKSLAEKSKIPCLLFPCRVSYNIHI